MIVLTLLQEQEVHFIVQSEVKRQQEQVDQSLHGQEQLD